MNHGLAAAAATLALAVSGPALAVPTLVFSSPAGMAYTAADQTLSVDADLVNVIDAGPVALAGSLQFTATLLGASEQFGFTFGEFEGPPTPGDLVVYDANNALLLTGELVSMSSGGKNGDNFGFILGMFSATGGSLLGDFGGGGSLFTFQFNLSEPFGPDLFDGDFTGSVDGSITATAIPEPLALWLTLSALGGLPLATIRQRTRRLATVD